MYTKLTNSYKLVSFNVVVVMTCKRCHTVTTKLTNLCYLKTYELKALDCQLKATSAFLRFRIEMIRHIIIL
ncbi:hypothetical protein CON07_18845 [Bacillus sp. AFS094611]|uniref:Uncharacterized protein n=2 Tax=Bacillus cereus group TaxID=86661 RepID=A0A2A7DDT6_BACAN|nr:hypothetical protein DY471_11165 [Bacillus anthracis]OTW67641.1 hypothetical protein BK707_20980 [Bacillus thuringiensis serovar coreanensis]OTX44258.1 hypothetical protein BK724_16275 [Bacillus thuringiensis serovar sooncheon]OTX53421.1 hypothetical protein BK725_14660 [Bacillus thuringiensis serovar guiyangiensis]OTX67742.1 hypothetical protein BK727_15680 [Bacillus thuringiensis serovar roskildiensis]PDZ50024.1 hypothetical protein CON07_18845 [Bacillus sp. AFS094611]RAT07783.1 hypothet